MFWPIVGRFSEVPTNPKLTTWGASPPRSKKGNEFQGKRSDSTEMKSLDFEVEIHFPTTLRKATHYFEKLRAGKLVADQPKIKK